MEPRHRVSRTAIELIKRFEGYRPAAAQLPDGRWTIGHGHTLTARQGAHVSADDAEALLLYDLIGIAHALNEAVFTPLNQNQFDALASFTFNIGLDSFHQSSVLKRLNEGALIQAACSMELWRKAVVGGDRIVVDALVRRRAAEKVLFLTPPGEAWVPAPSPILKPLLDTDAYDLVPLKPPAEVTAVLEGDQLVLLREGEPPPPPVDDGDEAAGPAKVAAEAVTARLSTIFQEPGEPAPSAEPETAAASASEEPETSPEPEEPVAEPPRPQADFAPPPSDEPVEDPVPFFLRAPEPEPEAPEPAAPSPLDHWMSRAEPGPDTSDREGDLFNAPEPAGVDDGLAVEPAGYAEEDGDPFARDSQLIDDAEPLDFARPIARPLPERPESGVLTLVALATLGLVFFGGGIFWASYARVGAGSSWLGPRLVGGLAGIAGVGFFVVAVYLLLDRLGRAAERAAREGR